jgi:hypothetical protein
MANTSPLSQFWGFHSFLDFARAKRFMLLFGSVVGLSTLDVSESFDSCNERNAKFPFAEEKRRRRRRRKAEKASSFSSSSSLLLLLAHPFAQRTLKGSASSKRDPFHPRRPRRRWRRQISPLPPSFTSSSFLSSRRRGKGGEGGCSEKKFPIRDSPSSGRISSLAPPTNLFIAPLARQRRRRRRRRRDAQAGLGGRAKLCLLVLILR